MPAWSGSRWAAEASGAMPSPRYPALFQVNTRVRLVGARGRAGANGDARRHPRRGARPPGRGRLRPRLVPRRLADRRGGPARLALEPRVARRVPPRPPRLPRGRRLRIVLRRPRLPRPRGLRRGRGARPPARAPEAPRPAAHPRLRPEPHGARPPMGRRAPGLLRVGNRGAARRAAAELLPRRNGSESARPRVWARSLLRRLAGHAPAGLRQPGAPGGDAGRAHAHRAAVRRRPLRHGDARPAGGLRADLGDLRRALLAPGDGGRPREGPGLPLPRRGLLGPRVDAAAAGLRLHLRQAALRSPGRGPRAAGARAPVRGPRLPGPPGPLPREPRRAAGRRHLRAGGAPGGRHPHVPHARPPLRPPGPARGEAGAHPGPSRARSGRGPRTRDRRVLRRPPGAA